MSAPAAPAPATPTVSASVDVAAPAAAVWAVVTDLEAMAGIAAETERMRWRSGTPATVGAEFSGSNRNGWHRWTTTCRVTDAEPDRTFGFSVHSLGMTVARWRYDVEPTGEGACRVTESTWDLRPGWFKRPGGWATGEADRDDANRRHIDATLAALKAHCEG